VLNWIITVLSFSISVKYWLRYSPELWSGKRDLTNEHPYWTYYRKRFFSLTNYQDLCQYHKAQSQKSENTFKSLGNKYRYLVYCHLRNQFFLMKISGSTLNRSVTCNGLQTNSRRLFPSLLDKQHKKSWMRSLGVFSCMDLMKNNVSHTAPERLKILKKSTKAETGFTSKSTPPWSRQSQI